MDEPLKLTLPDYMFQAFIVFGAVYFFLESICTLIVLLRWLA